MQTWRFNGMVGPEQDVLRVQRVVFTQPWWWHITGTSWNDHIGAAEANLDKTSKSSRTSQSWASWRTGFTDCCSRWVTVSSGRMGREPRERRSYFTQMNYLEAWSSAMRWVMSLLSPYALESEDRAAFVNIVVGICYRQHDQKGNRMNLPSNWVTSASGRPLFSRTTWNTAVRAVQVGIKQSSGFLQGVWNSILT